MKNIIQSLKLTLIGGVLVLFGCDDKLTEINTNPNNPEEVPTSTLIANTQKRVMDNVRNHYFDTGINNVFMQYICNNTYTDGDRYDVERGTLQTVWTEGYKAVAELDNIIALNDSEETAGVAAEAGLNEFQIAMCRVMKVYLFNILTDSFGDIPYSSYGSDNPNFQGGKGEEGIITPKYATQEEIYTDMLNELKESAVTLDNIKTLIEGDAAGAYASSVKGDLIYGDKGDLSAECWLRFANSLRLRIAHRLMVADATLSKLNMDELLSGELLIDDNSFNATFEYQDSYPSQAPYYSSIYNDNRRDYNPSANFVDLLKGDVGPIGTEDPRLGVFVKVNDNGDYNGQPYGMKKENASNYPIGLASWTGFTLEQANFAEILMEQSEVDFIISEYLGWDQSYYESGVMASLDKWASIQVENTITEASIVDYIDQLPAASKETVLTQKYIALSTQPEQSWANYRLHNYPDYLITKGDLLWTKTVTDEDSGVDTTTEYYFAPIFDKDNYSNTSGTFGYIPRRVYYPNNEQTLNRENYQAALTNQGEDNLFTDLWIFKN